MDAAKTRHFPKRDAQKAATRAKVLAAATDLFDRVGFEGLTIRDLARTAGLSTGAVFTCWTDKRALFDACFPADGGRRLIAESVCVGLHGPKAWETASRTHRDLCLQAADRALDSRALLQKVA